jgi:MoxR-like ATPase
MVIATQNPIEHQGTYPLPEAQIDRFLMKIDMGYLAPDEEVRVISSQKVEHPVESLKPVLDVGSKFKYDRKKAKVKTLVSTANRSQLGVMRP